MKDPICRACEDEKNSQHVAVECLPLRTTGLTYLGVQFLEPVRVKESCINNVVKIIEGTKLDEIITILTNRLRRVYWKKSSCSLYIQLSLCSLHRGECLSSNFSLSELITAQLLLLLHYFITTSSIISSLSFALSHRNCKSPELNIFVFGVMPRIIQTLLMFRLLNFFSDTCFNFGF